MGTKVQYQAECDDDAATLIQTAAWLQYCCSLRGSQSTVDALSTVVACDNTTWQNLPSFCMLHDLLFLVLSLATNEMQLAVL